MKKKCLAALSAAVMCLSSAGFTGINYSKPASALSVIAQVTEFSAEKTELTVGETVATNITWGIGTHTKVYYKSSDTEVATVDQNGNITAVGSGKAIITLEGYYSIGDKEIEVTVLPAEIHTYPTTYNEYKALLEQCPYFYRIDEDSVYFLNHDIHSMEMSLVVSSNNELSVSNDNYGFVFDPQEDGRYVVTVSEYCEKIVYTEVEIDGEMQPWHEHIFYPELYNYTVDVKDGEISVEYQGSHSWEENASSVDFIDVLNSTYFSFVNGQIPYPVEGSKKYITTIYGEYSTKSYFCVNALSEETVISDSNIADIDASFTISSYADGNLYGGTDDIRPFSRIIAKADGDVDVTISDTNDTYIYHLTVKDGIFHHANSSAPLDYPLGDVNGDRKFDKQDVEILGKWLTNKSDSELNLNKADFNQDGAINVFDVMLMRKALLEAPKSETKPMLMICSTEIREIGSYIHESVKVIDHLGTQYTLSCDGLDELVVRDAQYWCNHIEDIMESSNRETLIPIEDDITLGSIENFVSSASQYKDCEMKDWGTQIYDYGIDILYALYTDENGNLKPVALCRFGGDNAWLDNEDVQSFVRMMIEQGYFGDKEMFKYLYESYTNNDDIDP